LTVRFFSEGKFSNSDFSVSLSRSSPRERRLDGAFGVPKCRRRAGALDAARRMKTNLAKLVRERHVRRSFVPSPFADNEQRHLE